VATLGRHRSREAEPQPRVPLVIRDAGGLSLASGVGDSMVGRQARLQRSLVPSLR